ncbi:MAG: cytochrome c oxidase assembly protein [Candidatus Binataceae bacterium]
MGDSVNASGNLLRAWDFDPSIVIGCIALLAAYAFAHRGDYSRAPWFVAGVAAMFLALVSPLDALSDQYLFSAHMLQHLILILIVPPLLILGLSEKFARSILEVPVLARIERILATPAIAWTLAMAVLWIWHWPALYDATLADENVHIFEHLCFLVTATIFWWPIFAPIARAQMEPMIAIIYLATAMVANSVLGILLTFAQPGLYSAYLHPADSLGILTMLRDGWGLTPAVDQQLGGLLMWVPGGMVFLGAIMFVMARWYSEPEVRSRTAGVGAIGRMN